jgi:hypothetical protein
MMVGMGVLKGALVAMVVQETCGEHAQGSVGAHPIRDRLDQGTDVSGLSNKGYLH